MRKLTHEEFIEKLLEKNEYYRNGEFKVVGKYKSQDKKVIIKDKYGYLKLHSTNLFRNFKPSIRTAIHQHYYFINKLKDCNVKFNIGTYKIKGIYTNTDCKIKVKSEYGVHLMKPSSLLRNQKPEIRNCSNKELYLVNKFRPTHNDFYDYSEMNYINMKTKIKIICPIHGMFEQLVKDHGNGQGCKSCGRLRATKYIVRNPTGWSKSKWKEAGLKSKYFESFKVYIIKCWGNQEEFIKIGRTFNTIKNRFKTDYEIPYNYEVIGVYEGTAEEMFDLENQLQRENKKFKYIPKLKFNGYTECFNKNNH